jgi:pre-mRNA-splicing factor CDC5/CEF1
MTEARNLIALNNAQTPLLGHENTELAQGTGFSSATPIHTSIQTPNPMATPLHQSSFTDKMETPLRTPREEKISQNQRKRTLLQSLSSLPKPRNEWEIKLPDMDDEKEQTEEQSAVEDMSEIESELKKNAESEAKERNARRSLAVQLNLPRPTVVPTMELNEDASEIEKMIHEEFTRLLQHDAIKYPVAGGKITPGAVQYMENIEDEFDSETLDKARKEMDTEIKKTLGLSDEQDVKKAVWEHVSKNPEFENNWEKEHDELLFSAKFNRFLTLNEMNDETDMIQGLDKIVKVNIKVK